MKRTITFQITVNSYWPEKTPGFISFPVGGTVENRTIEFETDNKDPLTDANNALRNEMGDTPYHVWYWWWHDIGKASQVDLSFVGSRK